jgi:hypothetical protein
MKSLHLRPSQITIFTEYTRYAETAPARPFLTYDTCLFNVLKLDVLLSLKPISCNENAKCDAHKMLSYVQVENNFDLLLSFLSSSGSVSYFQMLFGGSKGTILNPN